MAESFIDLNLHGDSKENNILIDSLELFFQEIELSVKLAPNDIWGIYEAINLQRYVFNKFVSITQIKNEINTYIKRNCQHANDFNYNVTAETIKGDNGKDLIYIVVSVLAQDHNGVDQNFLQKFLLGS